MCETTHDVVLYSGGAHLTINYKVQLLTHFSCLQVQIALRVQVVYTQRAQEVSNNSVQRPLCVDMYNIVRSSRIESSV